MYWWSNIAVPESPESRVLVPADAAYSFGYSGQMQRVPIPVPSAPDVTYPTNIGHSTDFFYDIPPGRRPWIAALDAEGRGLIQTSTSRQCGRKLFVWGMGSGGRRWQEFLSIPGHPYIEIQAGLARTQYECMPMPPRTGMDMDRGIRLPAGVAGDRAWAGLARGARARADAPGGRASGSCPRGSFRARRSTPGPRSRNGSSTGQRLGRSRTRAPRTFAARECSRPPACHSRTPP